MIEKIISGGQTGADRAALDSAIELDIPHGGWIPKGRKTEDGGLPDKYHLKEMPTGSYGARTEQNVIDSDGTLIVSHGKLNGGSAKTRQLAKKHNRPWMHVDLDKTNFFKAAMDVRAWVEQNQIKVLNVAGPRGSKDPRIYEATKKLLTLVIQNLFPKTLDAAVTIILTEMRLKDKAKIANTEEAALSGLHMSLGNFIRRRFGLWSGNLDLLESCAKAARKDKIQEDEASALIIREVWKKLRKTYSLRAVK